MAKRKLSGVTTSAEIKFAAARASCSVVSLVSRNVPVEMGMKVSSFVRSLSDPGEIYFFGSGVIIDCQCLDNGNYLCTILAPASLFRRTSDISIHHIQTDVFVSGGVLHKPKLLACDFHYNLAALSIESDIPLQAATFKCIDDILSIDPTPHLPLPTFQLRPHSDFSKVLPNTQLFTVWRSHVSPYNASSGSVTFGSSRRPCPKGLSCNELYQLKSNLYKGKDGGVVVDSCGQFIGIVFNRSSFLPSNIVLRWWNNYKTSGGFRRPFLGMEVANLYDTDLDFLAQFMTVFPDISTAVVVTKVFKDSPATRSGIRIKDVIVKLGGKVVESKMKFYEPTWEKVGESVELDVLRVTNGEKLTLSLVIEEASPNKFHRWPYTSFNLL